MRIVFTSKLEHRLLEKTKKEAIEKLEELLVGNSSIQEEISMYENCDCYYGDIYPVIKKQNEKLKATIKFLKETKFGR